MLDSHFIEIARLLFQVGGGVAWALLFVLSWRMLAIIEKVVDYDRECREKPETKGTASSEEGMGAHS